MTNGLEGSGDRVSDVDERERGPYAEAVDLFDKLRGATAATIPDIVRGLVGDNPRGLERIQELVRAVSQITPDIVQLLLDLKPSDISTDMGADLDSDIPGSQKPLVDTDMGGGGVDTDIG